MSPLDSFDPLIREWFAARLGSPTQPQIAAWSSIGAGRDALLSAPTGSGKTLAAFLHCLNGLVRQARSGDLPDATTTVYVSPLKALSNDIQRNLERPLAEIRELAAAQGIGLPEIRTAVRTGDTATYDRQKMVDRPPHILVTTPESLYILLTAQRSRERLATVRRLIVDEIHAVADDKRGSHLALTVERLEDVVRQAGGRLQRVGLSATVRPIEEVARFLGPRFDSGEGDILQFGHTRPLELAVETTGDELGPVASHSLWDEVHDRLAELIREHRTTLVFVNTRKLAERTAYRLEEKLGKGVVLPHHGSLSRERRFDAERRLKAGELRAVVATASLELGIDIGSVDLVCHVGSPGSIAAALQRIGRSGHQVRGVSRGRFFPTTRDGLIDAAALVRAIRAGRLDAIEVPPAPLDILAQQIVAEVACGERGEEELYELVRRAYPYRDLSRESYDSIVEMLSEGVSSSRGRRGAYLHRDRVNGQLKPRRGARLAAITSGGAIPETAQYQVVAQPEGALVGMLDEDFAVESNAGDVFLLGTTSWRIRRTEPGKVFVEDAHGAAPTIPFWLGEAPGRTWELSEEVSRLREAILEAGPQAVELLQSECGLDRRGAEQAAEYIEAGRRALGVLPGQNTVVAERFFDESGGMQLVVHAPFGARVNRAWGLALRKRFCRSFNLELQAAATDNGVNISLTEQHAFPLELIFEFLRPETLEATLTQAMLASPMFTSRWRWNVSRALAVLRFSGGRKTPPPLQRMRSEDLLASVFPDVAACQENVAGPIRIPDHPLVAETIANCLHEAMDIDRLRSILEGIDRGEIRTVAVETREASPFAHEVLNAMPWAFLDDAPLEERRARAVQLRRSLPAESLDDHAALSAEAIEQVSDEVWPLVRDADELHDALLTLVVVPPEPVWAEWFEELQEMRRAAVLDVAGRPFWTAAERLALAQRAHPGGVVRPQIEAIAPARALPDSDEEVAAEILRGWLDSTGPATAASLAERLGLPEPTVELALVRLEVEGQVLRGRFTPGLPEGQIEWCNRRVLARIHRLTLGRLRREIEPVAAQDLMRFLVRWQRVSPGSRLYGLDGTLEALRRLEGVEAPAAAWESDILPARVADYQPAYLDQLCLSGEIAWGRLSPQRSLDEEGSSRRVRPTRRAPVSLFLRENSQLLLELAPAGNPALSHPAREIREALEKHGASFFADLTRLTGRLPSEVEEGLWELSAAGLVTADGFDNLRALIDPKRRRGEGRGKRARPRHAPGRWSLLRRPAGEDPEAAEFFARRLLDRWGVVFRDLIRREPLAPPWRDLLQIYRRLEARGEIRGGRFAAMFVGEQFALPEALELLRAVRRWEKDGEEVRIAASDPLNLVGVVLPGDRGSVGESLVLRDGRVAEPSQPQVARIVA